VKVAALEENLLLRSQRVENAAISSSGDVVDFALCSVTLGGKAGRSNGRYPSYYIGAPSNKTFHIPRILSLSLPKF
jgi:hypothetical protein